MAFRSPDHLEKYEYRPYELESELNLRPANNEVQERRELRFLVDYPLPIDWYKSWIEVSFRVNQLATGGNYVNAKIAPCCGAQSFVRSLQVLANGTTVYDGNRLSVGLFIKNLILFGNSYAATIAKRSFWALDNTPHIQDDNFGFVWRQNATENGQTVNAILPLNCFSFFNSLHDKILPCTKMELRFTLESDNNILWRMGAIPGPQAVAAVPQGRLIVTKFRLWTKTMTLGSNIAVDKFLKPIEWSYLLETVEESQQLRQISGSWVITPQAFKPRHVYIWFMNAEKKDNQEQNPFIFDSCDLRSCYLEFGGRRYPDTQYDSTEAGRIYSDIICDTADLLDASCQLTPDLLQSCYPMYHFDLRYRDPLVDGTAQKMLFTYSLSVAPQNAYIIYALTLSEAHAEVAKEGRQLVIRR